VLDRWRLTRCAMPECRCRVVAARALPFCFGIARARIISAAFRRTAVGSASLRMTLAQNSLPMRNICAPWRSHAKHRQSACPVLFRAAKAREDWRARSLSRNPYLLRTPPTCRAQPAIETAVAPPEAKRQRPFTQRGRRAHPRGGGGRLSALGGGIRRPAPRRGWRLRYGGTQGSDQGCDQGCGRHAIGTALRSRIHAASCRLAVSFTDN
jgi:hypothetical protein